MRSQSRTIVSWTRDSAPGSSPASRSSRSTSTGSRYTPAPAAGRVIASRSAALRSGAISTRSPRPKRPQDGRHQVGVEVGAHREQDHALVHPAEAVEQGEEQRPFVLRGQQEDRFGLVEEEQQPPGPGHRAQQGVHRFAEPVLRGGRSGAAEHPGQPPQRPRVRAQRPHQPAPGVRSRQPGQDARRHQGGLPGARGAHDEQEVLLPDPAADVVALLVTPEEQAGILGAEGEQPGVRAGQPFRGRRATLEQLPQRGPPRSPIATAPCSPAVPGSPDGAGARTPPGAPGPAGRNSALRCRAWPATRQRPTIGSSRKRATRPGPSTAPSLPLARAPGNQRGAGPEVLRRQDRSRIQSDLGKQEPVHPLGVALGVCHEQFRARLRAMRVIVRYPIHRVPASAPGRSAGKRVDTPTYSEPGDR